MLLFLDNTRDLQIYRSTISAGISKIIIGYISDYDTIGLYHSRLSEEDLKDKKVYRVCLSNNIHVKSWFAAIEEIISNSNVEVLVLDATKEFSDAINKMVDVNKDRLMDKLLDISVTNDVTLVVPRFISAFDNREGSTSVTFKVYKSNVSEKPSLSSCLETREPTGYTLPELPPLVTNVFNEDNIAQDVSYVDWEAIEKTIRKRHLENPAIHDMIKLNKINEAKATQARMWLGANRVAVNKQLPIGSKFSPAGTQLAAAWFSDDMTQVITYIITPSSSLDDAEYKLVAFNVDTAELESPIVGDSVYQLAKSV